MVETAFCICSCRNVSILFNVYPWNSNLLASFCGNVQKPFLWSPLKNLIHTVFRILSMILSYQFFLSTLIIANDNNNWSSWLHIRHLHNLLKSILVLPRRLQLLSSPNPSVNLECLFGAVFSGNRHFMSWLSILELSSSTASEEGWKWGSGGGREPVLSNSCWILSLSFLLHDVTLRLRLSHWTA